MSRKTTRVSMLNRTAIHFGVAAITVGICVFIWWVTGDPSKPPERPKPAMFKGAEIDAPITLVSADKTDLACVFEREVDGFHCAFKKKDEPWVSADATKAEGDTDPEKADGSEEPDTDAAKAEPRKKMLAPYMTVDSTLFLIPGLFEDPAVDERYRDDLPRRLPRAKQERFTAQCKLTLRSEVEGVLVRWSSSGAWQGPHKVWIGEASECRVSEP